MKKKVFVLQTVGTAASLAAAYLVLLVPDSTTGYLLLSLLLMYATVFLLSLTLAAVAWGLGGQVATAALPAGPQSDAGWHDLLRHGWQRWGRVAGILLAAGGLLYATSWLGRWRWPLGALIVLLAMLATPAVVHAARPSAGRIPRMLTYALLGFALAFASWKIASTPAELSRPWMEIGYLGVRVLTSFLVANLACLLLLAAGVAVQIFPEQGDVKEPRTPVLGKQIAGDESPKGAT